MKRTLALSQSVDPTMIQKAIEQHLGDIESQTRVYQQKIEQTLMDCQTVQLKLEKKKADIDRCQKRLKSLQGVRPAFMDEFERLEADLQVS